MTETFTGIYEVADGYVGKGRPQKFTIDGTMIENDFTEDDLKELFQRK